MAGLSVDLKADRTDGLSAVRTAASTEHLSVDPKVGLLVSQSAARSAERRADLMADRSVYSKADLSGSLTVGQTVDSKARPRVGLTAALTVYL